MALGAGLLDREETLLQADLAAALAGGAGLGLGARLGAAAVADLAGFHGGDADLGLGAVGRLFEGDFQVVAQIGTAIDVGASLAAAALAAEDFVEDAAEGIGKAARPAEAAPAGLGDDGVAELVSAARFWLSERIS